MTEQLFARTDHVLQVIHIDERPPHKHPGGSVAVLGGVHEDGCVKEEGGEEVRTVDLHRLSKLGNFTDLEAEVEQDVKPQTPPLAGSQRTQKRHGRSGVGMPVTGSN